MKSKKESISRQIALLYRQELWSISNLLENYNVTFAQLPFIMELYDEQGISQDSLAIKVQVDKAIATRALKQMEQKGLITREINPHDARSKLVFLTEEALSIRPHLLEILNQWNSTLTEDIADNEIEVVISAQRKMISNAKQFREKSGAKA